MKTQVGDIAMEYDIDGPEDGAVIMMHHSLATSHRMWDDLAIALCQNDRVLRYDARGHGDTDAPAGPYDFSQFVADATGLMDALGIDKAHHVGISMGGMICQHLAVAAPERVASLTLVSTASVTPPAAQEIWDKRLADVAANGVEPEVEATLKRWFTPDFRASEKETCERIGELVRATPVSGYLGAGAAIRNLDITGRLGEIRLPTLILVGADDPGTPPAVAKVIYDHIPESTLRELPAVSHMLPIQQPDEFLETLLDFIEDVDEDVWAEAEDEA